LGFPIRPGSLGRRLVLGRSLLEFGQLELELVDEPPAALAGLPEPLAPRYRSSDPSAKRRGSKDPRGASSSFRVSGI
jgi:hypothetical protein